MMQTLGLEIHILQIIRNQECVLGTTILYTCFPHIPSQSDDIQNILAYEE